MRFVIAVVLLVGGGLLIEASARWQRREPLQLGSLPVSPLQARIGGRLFGLLLLALGLLLLLHR